MAEALNRLERWTDSLLGELVWDETMAIWKGTAEFGDRVVQLQLNPDRRNPNREDQLAVIQSSRAVLDRVRQLETEFRRKAAEQISAALASQRPKHTSWAKFPQERFAKTLELQIVSLHGSGELHYRSQEFFPGCAITIFFNSNLAFGDVEVSDVKT